MRSLDEVLEKVRGLSANDKDRFGVDSLWVFGSYARGEQTADSDLDVLVEFAGPGMTFFRFIELEMALSELTGLKVDLVQRSALKERMKPTILSEAVKV